MASPADPAPKLTVAFANARLSLDDAERLAATFRPSWELDDAPFTGSGDLSSSEVQALQGGGTHADVRASQDHASNGACAPTAALAAAQEVEKSVIIDRGVAARDPALREAGPKTTMIGMPAAAPSPEPQPPVASQAPPRPDPKSAPITGRPAAPAFNVSPPAPARAAVDVPKRSMVALFVGVAAAAAIVVGGGVWLATSSGSGDKLAPAPTVDKALEDKLAAVPPPPPPAATATAEPTASAATATAGAAPSAAETASATSTQAAGTTVATSATAATASPSPPPVPAPPAPPPTQATPEPTHAVAAAPRPYGGGAPVRPAPAPAPHKPAQTIIRDVPF